MDCFISFSIITISFFLLLLQVFVRQRAIDPRVVELLLRRLRTENEETATTATAVAEKKQKHMII